MPEAATNRDINKVQIEDRPVHEWYRFVLSFPPHLVREYLEKLGAHEGDMLLDPFCGTGTTLVEGKKRRLRTVGVEANPMACFASEVKTNWTITTQELLDSSLRFTTTARRLLRRQGLPDSDLPLFSMGARPAVRNLRTLPVEQSDLLLTNSISPRPLHRTLVLLDCVRRSTNPWTPHQELALARSIVDDISNLHFGPEVGLGKIKHDVDVVSCWEHRINDIGKDLALLAGKRYPISRVYHGDARNQIPLRPKSIDWVITSPPYPNEKDYTRTTRLESVILGFLKNKADLRQIKNALIRSNTRNVFRADTDGEEMSQFPRVQRIAREIERRRVELGKTSGFERMYHRVVLHYFGGMKRHLTALAKVLRPGARCAYVVGDQASYFQVHIPTVSY